MACWTADPQSISPARWISQSSNRPRFSAITSPRYEVPGTKILGPAFGILSTSTTLRRANDINTLVYTGVANEYHSDCCLVPIDRAVLR